MAQRFESEVSVVQGIRFRGLVAGSLLVLWVNFWITYAEYVVHASRMNLSHFPVALFASFVVLIGSAGILRKLSDRFHLTGADFSVALAMGMVGAMVPTSGLMGFFLGVIATPFYFANPENKWGEFFHPHIPHWLAPRDEGHALTWFFDGPPQVAEIPWVIWLIPIFWWLVFIGAVIAVSMGLAVMLRKPWSENERLVYPLLGVAGDLLGGKEGKEGLFQKKVFWMGVGIALFIAAWNITTYFWTLMPRIDLSGSWFVAARDFPRFNTRINLFTVGFAYLANLEVLFSLWFFFLLVGLEVFLFNRFGFTLGGSGDDWSSETAAASWQSFGAMVVMVLWGLWVAREHLSHIVSDVWHGRHTADEEREILSYRSALLSVVIGTVVILFWLAQAGMAFSMSVLFVFGTFVVYLGVARIVSEAGLVYVRAPLTPQNFSTFTLGSTNLSGASLTASGFTYALLSQGKGLFMVPLVHVAKVGEGLTGDRRRLGWAIIWSVLLGIVLCVFLTLHWGYENGAYNFSDYPFSSGSKGAFNHALKKIRNPTDVDWTRMSFMGAGATTMIVLIILRYRFAGWPLHPIGFTIPMVYTTINSGFAIFLTWAIKSMVMRIGGVTLYQRTRPFFVGLATGYALGIALTFLVDWIWFYGQGHRIHSW